MLEESFGNQGTTVVDFGFNLYSSSFWAGSILVQSIGKLIVAGSQGLPDSNWGTAKSGGLGLAKAEISIAATNPPRPPTAAPSSSGGGPAGVGMLVLLATMIVKRCAPLNNKRPRAGAAV